jgi:hypothetical protein
LAKASVISYSNSMVSRLWIWCIFFRCVSTLVCSSILHEKNSSRHSCFIKGTCGSKISFRSLTISFESVFSKTPHFGIHRIENHGLSYDVIVKSITKCIIVSLIHINTMRWPQMDLLSCKVCHTAGACSLSAGTNHWNLTH